MTEGQPPGLSLDQIKLQAPPTREEIPTADPRGPIEAQVSRIGGKIVFVVPGSARWMHPEAAPAKRGRGEEI